MYFLAFTISMLMVSAAIATLLIPLALLLSLVPQVRVRANRDQRDQSQIVSAMVTYDRSWKSLHNKRK